jgi:hypothetical protein
MTSRGVAIRGLLLLPLRHPFVLDHRRSHPASRAEVRKVGTIIFESVVVLAVPTTCRDSLPPTHKPFPPRRA